MPDPRLHTIAGYQKAVPITIPGSGSATGTTLRALLLAGGLTADELTDVVGVKILGLKADASNRAAFNVTNEATAASWAAIKQPVPVAVDWYEPIADPTALALRAAAVGSIAAVAVVYLS